LRPKSSTNFVRPEAELSVGAGTLQRDSIWNLWQLVKCISIYTSHFNALQDILSLFYVFDFFGFSYFCILELDEGTNPKFPCNVMKDKGGSRLK
jgi:hypothetical protein